MTFEHGKVPPQSIQLEEAVIGSFIEITESQNSISAILKPEMFYKESHQLIYESILRLVDKSEPVDLMTVVEELKSCNNLEVVGGAYFITQLTNYATLSNWEYYSRIIAQNYIKREIIRISSESINYAFDDTIDVFDLLERTKNNFEDLEIVNGSEITHIEDELENIHNIMDKNAVMDDDISGIPTGYDNYDFFNKGDQNGITVIGARPSQGKTAWCIQKSIHQSKTKNVGFITYEMTSLALSARCLSFVSKVPYKQILFQKMTIDKFEKINSNINKLIDSGLYLITPKTNELSELISIINTLYYKYKIDVLVIDYLQKIEVSGEKEMKSIIRKTCNRLQSICNNLQIPITLISELRRSQNNRPPIMSDMMESSAIEYAADIIGLMWQPSSSDYGYDSIYIQSLGEDISTENLVVLDQVKGRNTGTTKFYYEFDGTSMSFDEKNFKIPF